MISTTLLQTLPGPRPLPLIGGKHNLIKLYRRPFEYMRWLHTTYGDVVGLGEGDSSYVCAFGPECNHQLLSNPDLFHISAGPFEKLLKDTPLGRVGGQSLQMMKGEHHRQQRRLMQPAFHKAHIDTYHEAMVTLTQQMMEHWRPGLQIDIYEALLTLTRQIVTQTLFGLDKEMDTEHFGELLERIVALMPLALVMPLNIPGLPYRRAMNTAAQFETELQALINHKRATSNGRDLLSLLIQARDEDGTTLTDGELISHTFTLFSAGHETSTVALAWTLFLLCQHPHTYAKLLDELSTVLGGEPPTAAQIRQLPYLDQVVREGLRLLSPATVGMRRTAEACELQGYALPKGSTIVFSQFVTHRIPALYPEPDRFRPERWESIKPGPYEYLPFSAGAHRCIGAEFAMHEIKTVLATLLPVCSLTVEPQTRLDVKMALQPKNGLPIRVLPPEQLPSAVPVQGEINNLVELEL